ncbi:MAG: response regulator transcription factor [Myxococcales bacterium]|nr:response regulator transcription factor [Myxococcales bacterium]
MPNAIHVLVVEDSPELREALRRALSAEGYRPALAASIAEGRALLRNEERGFDLTILDLQLPDGRGETLLDDIDEVDPRPVVVVMSGEADSATIVRLRKRCDAVLPKPYTRETVIEIVRELLEEREQMPASVDGRLAKFAGDRRLSLLETDALRLYVAGKTDDAIAEELDIRPESVATLWTLLLRKTGATDRQDLMKVLLGYTTSTPPKKR